MDLKIEIRKLLALHEASKRLQHGVRETQGAHREWREFAPSRFVYAFFTFNSIYSFNWEKSFSTNKAVPWEGDNRGNFPKEEDQIKSYVKFVDSQLSPDTATLVMSEFSVMVEEFGVHKPADSMRSVELVNPAKGLRSLARPMPTLIEKFMKRTLATQDLYATLTHMLRFVYLVRCNVFHGVKTQVEMAKPDQQQRLLLYTALLIASNGLLFHAASRSKIGWQDVNVSFTSMDTPPSAAWAANHGSRV